MASGGGLGGKYKTPCPQIGNLESSWVRQAFAEALAKVSPKSYTSISV